MNLTKTITGVGVLDKGVAIIDLCQATARTAAEIADELDMSVPTAHRLCAALVAHGLLQRSPDGRHHLGSRFLAGRLAELAQPLLDSLTSRIGESSQLWVRRGTHRVCVASAVTPHELRVDLTVGTSLPITDGGSAVPVLQDRPLDGPGWSESVSQRTVGIGSVSAPVRVDGAAVAAVCVVVPSPRITTSPGQQYGALAIEVADQLAAILSS